MKVYKDFMIFTKIEMCQQLDPEGHYSVPDSFTSYLGVGSGHGMILNKSKVRERERLR